MRTIILGAGITGLAAGIKTGAPIYEAADKPGGICRSYDYKGFSFQNGGGHWIFGDSAYKPLLNQFSGLNHYQRKAGIFYNHIFPYPIQSAHGPEEHLNPGSLKAWMQSRFGKGLCNVFFHPFNEKYTAGLYNEVIQDDEKKSPSKGSGYNDRFSYPDAGLTAMVEEMESDCDVCYCQRAIDIDLNKKIVRFDTGESSKYDRLISTIPLEELLNICHIDHDPLPYTSVRVLNIGAMKGPKCPDEHWVYIPFSKAGFFRVGFYSNVDPKMAPEGAVSLCVEAAFRPQQELDADYENKVLDELYDWGWIQRTDCSVVDENIIPYAYTWLRSANDRKNALGMLKDLNVISTGRYGKWKFQGILESFGDGMSVDP